MSPLPVTGVEQPGAGKVYEKLGCVACHKPDPAGRYMLPISYDDHCKRCHPLSVRIVGIIKGDQAREAAELFARTPAPHPKAGESVETVRAVLRERFLRFVQQYPLVLAGPEAEPVRTRVDPRSPQAITEQHAEKPGIDRQIRIIAEITGERLDEKAPAIPLALQHFHEALGRDDARLDPISIGNAPEMLGAALGAAAVGELDAV